MNRRRQPAADGWDAEIDGCVGAPLHLGQFVFGAGEADFEAFDFTKPSLLAGFNDTGLEVVADLEQAGLLVWVGPEQGASDAGVFVDAVAAERAAAGPGRYLAALEVSEELLSFLGAGLAVFLARSQDAAPGDKRPVEGDGFLRIDGLVSHGDADVLVAGDDLRDVRR